MTICCRGLRGATTAPLNDSQAILTATTELLQALIQANGVQPDDVASVIFTVAPDLDAAYPALAARELGWTDPALMCATEIPVPNGLARCIRVLIHWNTSKSQSEMRHVYLRDAVKLRPDLNGGNS